MKRGCDLLIFKDKVKRSQPRFTRQLLRGRRLRQLLQETGVGSGLLHQTLHPPANTRNSFNV